MTLFRAPRGLAAALTVALVVLAGCERSSPVSAVGAVDMVQRAPSSEAMSEAPEAVAAPPVDTATARRITTGEATVEVARVDRARTALVAAVRRAGGYVGSEEAWDTETARSARLTLRLPASRTAAFDSTLNGLGRVTRRTTQVEDVTAQYVDLAARLKARRAVEMRYVDLLARAASIEDVVAVEEKLASVREEIEVAEGQIRLWDRQVAFSTLTVTLEEPRAAAGRNVWGRIGDALADGWTFLEELLLGLIRLWPLLLIVPALLWVWRRRPRRRVRPVVPPVPPSEPVPPVE